MSDRRKYARLGTDQVISFAILDSNDQLAISKDVSPGGIRFEAVGCELDLGDTIRVLNTRSKKTIEGIVAGAGRIVVPAMGLDAVARGS